MAESTVNNNSTATSTATATSTVPSDDTLIERLTSIISTADLSVTTSKSIRLQLESEYQCSLESRKKFLSENTKRLVEERTTADAAAAAATESKSESESEPEPAEAEDQESADRRLAEELQLELSGGSRPRRSAASDSFKKADKRKLKEYNKANGINQSNKPKRPPKKLILSTALSEFLNTAEMSRGDIVKSLWAYIKLNSLQNPSNKQQILLDDKLKLIFGSGRKMITMFNMNKLLQDHIIKPGEVNE